MKIQLEKEFQYAGDKVRGVLLLDHSNRMRARRVRISFAGKEQTKLVKGIERYRRVHQEENWIVQEVIDIWTAADSKYLEPGNQTFPFELQLPEDAPPSVTIRKNRRNNITYEIRAKVDRPFAFDPNANTIITVLPAPISVQDRNPIEDTLQDPNGKLHLEVVLDQKKFALGQSITGKVKFKKDPSIKVRAVEATLTYTESLTARGYTKSAPFQMGSIRWDVDPKAEYYEWPLLLATNEENNYSINGRLIKRFWKIDVKVNRPLKKDYHISIPLLMCSPKMRLGDPT